MQKRLHNFMDKMREKTVEERRKILLRSVIALFSLVGVFGFWNISNDFVALSSSDLELAVEKKAEVASPFASIGEEIASAWSSVNKSLKELNDELGNEQGQ